MTEIRVIKTKPNPDPFGPPTIDVLYLTKYRYDEAGNRVRKVRYKYTGSTPDPEFDLSGDAPPWTMQSDEFYVRDVSGKEIAIYTGSGLTQCSNGVPSGEHLPAFRNVSAGRGA